MNFAPFCIIASRRSVGHFPHEKINQGLTDINRCLTDTENQFYKVSVISVKYRLSIGLYQSYWLDISLLIFLP